MHVGSMQKFESKEEMVRKWKAGDKLSEPKVIQIVY